MASVSTDIIQISSVPSFGPAGSLANDPDFDSTILRVTDGNTDSAWPNSSYWASIGGEGDLMQFNSAVDKFLIDRDGNGLIFNFDPSGPSAEFSGLVIPTGTFSYKNPNYVWVYGKRIKYYDISQSSPKPNVVADFTSLLPLGFEAEWNCPGGSDLTDSTLLAAVSAGIQDTGFYVLAAQGGKLYVFDTMAGTVNGQSINIPDRFLIHNIRLTKNGVYAVIVAYGTQPTQSAGAYLWQVGTENVIPLPTFQGHFTTGLNALVSKQFIPTGAAYEGYQYANTPIPNGSPADIIQPISIVQVASEFDGHPSWHMDQDDTQPFFDSTYDAIPGQPFTCPWQNEVISVDPTTGIVSRYCHNFISGASPYFATKYGIGTSSPDGKWFIFSSDMMNTLGTDSEGNPRSDVFVVNSAGG